MKHYSKNISFLNLLMRNIRWMFLLLLFITATLQIGSLYRTLSTLTYQTTQFVNSYNEETDEYEVGNIMTDGAPSFAQCLHDNRFELIYFLGFLALIFLLIFAPTKLSMYSNCDYTLHRLGISNKRRFYLTMLHNLIMIFTYVFVEILVIGFSLWMYHTMVESKYLIYNMVFQAYVTNQFIRTLLPVTTPVLLLIMLLVYTFFAYFAVGLSNSLKARNYSAFAIGFFWIAIVFNIITDSEEYISLGMILSICLAITVAQIRLHSKANYRIEIKQPAKRKEEDSIEEKSAYMAH